MITSSGLRYLRSVRSAWVRRASRCCWRTLSSSCTISSRNSVLERRLEAAGETNPDLLVLATSALSRSPSGMRAPANRPGLGVIIKQADDGEVRLSCSVTMTLELARLVFYANEILDFPTNNERTTLTSGGLFFCGVCGALPDFDPVAWWQPSGSLAPPQPRTPRN